MYINLMAVLLGKIIIPNYCAVIRELSKYAKNDSTCSLLGIVCCVLQATFCLWVVK